MTAIVEANEEYSNLIYDFVLGENVGEFPQEFIHHILEIYANDLNSSTLREFVTLKACGYKEDIKKLGRDGWDEFGKPKEVKPRNIITQKLQKDKNGNPKGSFSFGGNFSDYTMRRFQEDLKDDLGMVCSLFIDGKLMSVVEFSIHQIYDRLKTQLDRGVETGQKYVRSCSFTFSNIKDVGEVQMKYLNEDYFRKAKNYLTKGTYEFLEKFIKKEDASYNKQLTFMI